MSSIHDKAKAHFRGLRGELQSIEVPELGEGTKVYYYQKLTGAEMVEILPLINVVDPAKSDYRVVFKLFAAAARYETGKKLFTSVNYQELEDEWDFDLVNDLVGRMGLADRNIFGASDAAKKN